MIADLGIVKSVQSSGRSFFATSGCQLVACDVDQGPTYAATCPVTSQVLDLDEIILEFTTDRPEPAQKSVRRRLEVRHSYRDAETLGLCETSSVKTL